MNSPLPQQGSLTFGRSRQCDVVIEATAVSNRHGRITPTPDGFLIEDLGSTNGVYVNGSRIQAATHVTRNDRVTLGIHVEFPWQLLPSVPSARPFQPHPSPAQPFGQPSQSPNPFASSSASAGKKPRNTPFGSAALLNEGSSVTPEMRSDGPGLGEPDRSGPGKRARTAFIGRDPTCDLVLNVPTVSWRHAQVTSQDGRVTIVDLESANGVFVGSVDRRVESAEIDPADTIYFGSHPVTGSKLFEILSNIPDSSIRTPPIGISPDEGSSAPIIAESASSPFAAPVQPQPLGANAFSPKQPVTMEASFNEFQQSRPPVSVPISDRPITLGRDPSCDHVLNYPMISRHHCRITPTHGQLIVEDLGSRNGTYVNGRRIDQPQTVGQGDTVALGSFSITLGAAESRIELIARDTRGELAIEARNVTVAVPGKRLLENVSLTIRPGEFVGLMGPSGAGKSTLMNALNGYVAPSDGAVFVDGKNLHEHYDLFRGQIGYVPQDDIMHRNLTVRQALYYTARLRFPPDYSDSEIHRRIAEVLQQLGLQGTENVLIGSPEKKGISGGQRKRVNLAMELLTDPSILFLDEPTSGLSSEDAVLVMKLLRDLASRGKTILLTIHQPSLEAYRMMDHLVMISKDAGSTDPGRLAYFGPAYPDAVHFFNPDGMSDLAPGADPSPDEILRGLKKQPTTHWTNAYQQSHYRAEYVTRRQGRVDTLRVSLNTKRRREAGILQAWTLFRRNLTLKLRDRSNTALLLFQAPIIAALIAMVFSAEATQDIDGETWPDVAKATATTLFLLALSSLWCGCSNSVREIVGEWAIYKRERMVNLKIPSYVASKLAVLIGLSIIQTTLLLGIAYLANGLQGNFILMFIILMLASTLGVAIGLFISSLAPSSEFAVAMLPIVILPMVMLGGVLQPVPDMPLLGRGATYLTPSRWSFEAVLLVEASQKEEWQPSWAPPHLQSEDDVRKDIAETFFPKDDHRSGVIPCFMVLSMMLVAALGVVALILRKRDVH